LIVVFDASALISAALKADSVPERALFRAMTEPNQLILSQEVEDEYREVLYRPKFDRFVLLERRKLILDIAIFVADRVEPSEAVHECRDPKDDKYLALAAAGSADCIVSSDLRHLVSMHPWRGIPILSPGDYLALP
jgi:putative PIN family toxin of toxin-antitoxin system